MEAAQQYVSQLKELRAREDKRREERRRRRNEYMQVVQLDSESYSREALREDVRRHLARSSAMEKQLLSSMRHTAKWWDALCDRSIERRLTYEKAVLEKREQHVMYLGNVLEREHRELVNVVGGDEKRWRAVQEQFLAHKRAMKEQAVSDTVGVILQATGNCIDFLQEYCVEDSKNSFLGQFALSDVIRNSIRALSTTSTWKPSTKNALHAASMRRFSVGACQANGKLLDVFQKVFGGNPFLLTSPHFRQLVDLLYQHSRSTDTRASLTSFDVSGVPVIIVDGLKYSGKTLLTEMLEKQFGFRCFSNCQLVQIALDADKATESAKAVELTSAELKDGKEQVRLGNTNLALEDEWAAIGRRVRDVLLKGGAVDVATVAELFQLQLRSLRGCEGCAGVVFDGVISCAVEYRTVKDALLPLSEHPHTAIHATWCPEDLQYQLQHFPQATQLAQQAQQQQVPSPRSGNAGASAFSPAASTTHLPTAAQDVSSGSGASVWAVRKVPVEEVGHRREPRAKVGKRGTDTASVPPPELPEVTDVTALIEAEQQFIERAQDQLRSFSDLFAAILHIQCSPREIFQRFAGLRVDRETGEEYHMTYHPPPQERVPFLTNVDRTQAYTAHLHDIIFQQQQCWEALQKWLHCEPAVFANVHELNGESSLPELEAQASTIVKQALEKYHSGQELYASVVAARERITQLNAKHAEEVAVREAERQRLVALYTEKCVPLPVELEPVDSSDVYYDIPAGLPDVLLGAVRGLTNHYTRAYDWAWGTLGNMAKVLLEYRIISQAYLQRFWEQPDDKQEVLNRFVAQFNAIPAASRSKVVCKEELHTFVDELADTLFSIVDFKQRDCLSLIDYVTRRDAFLDGWESNLCNVGIAMAQAEVERFTAIANITLQYFAAVMEEPFMVEEIETDVTFIRPSTEPATHEPSSATRATKDRKVPGARKGTHMRTIEEGSDRIIDEVFSEILNRLSSSITAFTDKFKASMDIKNMKKMSALNATKATAIAARCVPILESELASTQGRLRCVRAAVSEVARQGDGYMNSVRAEMQCEAREMFVLQAAAVNSALYALRNHIEMERMTPSMHLGAGTFAILESTASSEAQQKQQQLKKHQQKVRSFITDVPLYAQLSVPAVRVHPTLTGQRLMEIIHMFRCLAPNFQLARDDFVLVVEEEDYSGAMAEGLVLKGVSELFRTFDCSNCGIIDWREFIVHLLFWCTPPPRKAAQGKRLSRLNHRGGFYIPEITVEQLLSLKSSLGSEPVTEQAFHDASFFFDQYMSDDRLEAYTRALWATFSDRETAVLDSYSILWFLCADMQPIRGAQKALYVLAPNESGRFPVEEMARISHVQANNHSAVGLADPFSNSNLRLLFGESESLSFEETCACVMGRKMLNSVDMFHRKRFVYELP